MKIYDFDNISITKEIENIYEASIQQKIKENTKIISTNNKEYQEKILDNYCNMKNYKASFIKSDFCFNVFLRFFRLYKENNINLDLNKILHYRDFLENNKKQIIDYDFKGENLKQLKQLFERLKNND